MGATQARLNSTCHWCQDGQGQRAAANPSAHNYSVRMLCKGGMSDAAVACCCCEYPPITIALLQLAPSFPATRHTSNWCKFAVGSRLCSHVAPTGVVHSQHPASLRPMGSRSRTAILAASTLLCTWGDDGPGNRRLAAAKLQQSQQVQLQQSQQPHRHMQQLMWQELSPLQQSEWQSWPHGSIQPPPSTAIVQDRHGCLLRTTLCAGTAGGPNFLRCL
jgi:hypothetical protein